MRRNIQIPPRMITCFKMPNVSAFCINIFLTPWCHSDLAVFNALFGVKIFFCDLFCPNRSLTKQLNGWIYDVKGSPKPLTVALPLVPPDHAFLPYQNCNWIISVDVEFERNRWYKKTRTWYKTGQTISYIKNYHTFHASTYMLEHH